jgi:hypothetical protein
MREAPPRAAGMENKMTRYVSLEQAVLDFRVSARKLVNLTGDGGEFPLCKWAGTLYFDSTELEKKFRWRKSRSQRAREVPFVLLNFQRRYGLIAPIASNTRCAIVARKLRHQSDAWRGVEE